MTKFIKTKISTLIVHKITNLILMVLIFAVAIFYAYSANSTVRILTALEKTKEETQSLGLKVSEMEAKRLAVENSFSIKKALNLGFVEVKNPIFIVKRAKEVTLSLKMN